MPTPTTLVEGANVAVIIGTLSRPPEARVLPSGDEVLALEVTVRSGAGGPAETVPVAWFAASRTASTATWPAGHPVAVVGRVRRRFFRAGGITQSRVEVVADQIVPLRRRAATRKALAAAVERLQHASAA